MSEGSRNVGFVVPISADPPVELVAERLRDGRIALGTRTRSRSGRWEAGELHLLDPAVQLDLAAWLTEAVEDGWLDTVRARREAPVQTAAELYGEGPGSLQQLALATLAEIPPPLLARAMILLANALGPHARARIVERLNATTDPSEEAELRRRLADENEAFAYAVAAAGLFDAISEEV